jgi:signal transduction histidine kinase
MLAALPKTRQTLVLTTLATLAVFGGLVAGITFTLRGQLRDEVLRREAQAMDAVAQLEISDLAGAAASPSSEDLFTAVLKSTRLRGVFAVQLFDAAGALRDALPIMPEHAPAPDWPLPLDAPLARYNARGSWDAAYGFGPQLEGDTLKPLLEIFVRLHAPKADTKATGVARYWLDGGSVAAEFARLDRRLMQQAGLAFLGGAILVALVLAVAFARLGEANRMLAAQSADLARANQELDFAAKTGAVGAITAHLSHGLKNPLSGLEGFVAENAPDTADPLRGEAWRHAADTTRRLRAMVNEVMTVLRDEASGSADYRIPVGEVTDALRARVGPQADTASVRLVIDATGAGTSALIARTANLASLVVVNLLGNAIEASPAGTEVRLDARSAPGGVEFSITDHGAGLPEAIRHGLFRPVRSTKAGGGGIGLAISYQLARHAGGELTLVRSDAAGTVFRLVVPAATA